MGRCHVHVNIWERLLHQGCRVQGQTGLQAVMLPVVVVIIVVVVIVIVITVFVAVIVVVVVVVNIVIVW